MVSSLALLQPCSNKLTQSRSHRETTWGNPTTACRGKCLCSFQLLRSTYRLTLTARKTQISMNKMQSEQTTQLLPRKKKEDSEGEIKGPDKSRQQCRTLTNYRINAGEPWAPAQCAHPCCRDRAWERALPFSLGEGRGRIISKVSAHSGQGSRMR